LRRADSLLVNEAVKIENFTWAKPDLYYTTPQEASFSMRNLLNQPIKDVVARIVFLDTNQIPVDSMVISSKHLKDPARFFRSSYLKPKESDYVNAVIPPENAVRIPIMVQPSVKKLSAETSLKFGQPRATGGARMSIQIISFNIVETKASGGRFDPANLFGN
jgi:hypothetical protein